MAVRSTATVLPSLGSSKNKGVVPAEYRRTLREFIGYADVFQNENISTTTVLLTTKDVSTNRSLARTFPATQVSSSVAP